MGRPSKPVYWATAPSMTYPEGRVAGRAPGGPIVVLNADTWTPAGVETPPPEWTRLAVRAARRLAEQSGFTFTPVG